MRNFRLTPTQTIIRQTQAGERVRVVAADAETSKVKVIRLRDGMPLTVFAADIGLRLPS